MSVTWRGYSHLPAGVARHIEITYHIELSEERAAELWKELKNWTGSQKEFYFKFVNKTGLCEMPRKRVYKKPIKTELKGGKRA